MMRKTSMTGADEFNFEDQSYTLLRKCNLADTIPATILSNLFINKVDKMDPMSYEAMALYPASTLLWVADWYSVITTVMEISYSMEIYLDRMDWYNVGKIMGKATKLVVQIKMKDSLHGTY